MRGALRKARPVKAVKPERRENGNRIDFLGGWRVLSDYRKKRSLPLESTKSLSVDKAMLPEAVQELG